MASFGPIVTLSKLVFILVLWPCFNHAATIRKSLVEAMADQMEGVYRQAVRSSMFPSMYAQQPLWTLDDGTPQLKWRSFMAPHSRTVEGLGDTSVVGLNMSLLSKRDQVRHNVEKEVEPFQRDDEPVGPEELFEVDTNTPHPLKVPVRRTSYQRSHTHTEDEQQESAHIMKRDADPQIPAPASISSSDHVKPPPSFVTKQGIPKQHVLMIRYTGSGRAFESAVGKAIYLRRSAWVTAFPQLRDFCRSLDDDMYTWRRLDREPGTHPNSYSNSLRTLRILQYLGLQPTLPSSRNYIVAFWVQPKDVFRPCFKPGVKREECDLSFLWETDEGLHLEIGAPTPGNDTDGQRRAGTDGMSHADWFHQMAVQSQSYNYLNGSLDTIYPWTRLGYTYDYGGSVSVNDNETALAMGATEFVIREGARVIVDRVENLYEHCK